MPLPLDAVRVTVLPFPGPGSAAGGELANRVVRFGGAASVSVGLEVPLVEPSGWFVVRVAATDAASPADTVFRGEEVVTVERGGATGGGGEPVAPVEVALSYAGADVVVDSIELAPVDTSFTLGDSVRIRAVARRADGSAVPTARIRLSVDDQSASLTPTGFVKAGSGNSAPFAGAWVYAGTANGVVDSVRVFARRPGGSAWTVVAGGNAHTCALDAAGAAYCWGANGEGQLGDGTFTDRAVPTPVADGLTFVSITAGAEHTCALTNTGVAYCWGSTFYGKLGEGTSGRGQLRRPTAVAGGLRFQWLDAGDQHSCGVGLLAAGEPGPMYCWGNNSSGRLGDGTQTNRAVPTLAAAEVLFSTVDAGGSHTCALTPDGHPYCRGYNGDGQVGDGTYGNQQGGVADRLVPTAVATQLAFREVHTGGYHSCGLTTGGAAYCWGDNNVWQIGNGAPPQDVTTPAAVLGGHTFTLLRVGGGHSCGLESSGSLWCWGINADGQLGDGTTSGSLTMVRARNDVGLVEISAGGTLPLPDAAPSVSEEMKNASCGRTAG
ncbi:MAG TPA: hypothetical protein VKA84_19535, partial [Gemmatimonadaceae bacterium]|nr:hypothetical protein [Gemmatimonadaceae bacterium]